MTTEVTNEEVKFLHAQMSGCSDDYKRVLVYQGDVPELDYRNVLKMFAHTVENGVVDLLVDAPVGEFEKELTRLLDRSRVILATQRWEDDKRAQMGSKHPLGWAVLSSGSSPVLLDTREEGYTYLNKCIDEAPEGTFLRLVPVSWHDGQPHYHNAVALGQGTKVTGEGEFDDFCYQNDTN
jgi:hypothetical protein